MPRPLVDLSALDLTRRVMSEEELRALLPHEHEFRMIDAICFVDVAEGLVVGRKEFDADPWWARGHIPGRPLLPGVLMIEGSAQVATILMKRTQRDWNGRFVGMTGVNDARFRGVVVPPAQVFFVAKVGIQTPRIARYHCQCFTGGKMVFEMELLGMPI